MDVEVDGLLRGIPLMFVFNEVRKLINPNAKQEKMRFGVII